MDDRVPSFSQRLAHRQHIWWGRPGPREAVHRPRERHARRSRDDPDEVWRCCRFWPRVVCNKRNGREFALKHGLAVPELYWSGSDFSRVPLQELPAHFVVRPIHGVSRHGVLVVGDPFVGRGVRVLQVGPLRAANRVQGPRLRGYRGGRLWAERIPDQT
jgi:hypothetical protein